MEFLIVSGLSGAGKSKAVSVLEDMGFYCVDNLPAPLIGRLAEQCMAGSGRYERVAVVNDIRGGQTFDSLFAALDELSRMHCPYEILFIEASTETIIKRFKETRRSHPLCRGGCSLEQAIARERAAMEPVRRQAQYIIDTSALSTAKLRGELLRLFGGENPQTEMAVSVTSFGYKYGLPLEADLVFDVRFLPNPYYIAQLRGQTGLDVPVDDFVFQYRQTLEFMTRLEDLLSFLLPHYIEEGKTALVIAIGCTGGRHRSVAIAHHLAELLGKKGYRVSETHRDISRVAYG